MPIVFLKSHRDELIDEALHLLLPPTSADLPGGPITQAVRQEIEQICTNFTTSLEEASASPGIKKAHDALGKMANDAAALAKQFRQDDGRFIFGAATFSWDDTPEQDAEKRQEIEHLQEDLLPAAEELDRIAEMLRARIAKWENKRMGELHAYENVFGAPKKQLAKAAGKLFHQHRPNDLDAGRKGDFYRLVELLFEAATGKEPDGDELLRHVQEAVRAIRGKL